MLIILPDGSAVDTDSVEGLKVQGENTCDIYLKNGLIMKVYCSVSTVIAVLNAAKGKGVKVDNEKQ